MTTMRCTCTGHVHSFACYLRNIAYRANNAALDAGTALNAR